MEFFIKFNTKFWMRKLAKLFNFCQLRVPKMTLKNIKPG